MPPQNGPNQTYYELAYPQPYDDVHSYNYIPSQTLSGPLLTSILAIFGNKTFFDTVASRSNYADPDGMLCHQLRPPFLDLTISDGVSWGSALFNASDSAFSPVCEVIPNQTSNDSLLLNALLDWLQKFGNAELASAAFTLATSSTNMATLNSRYNPHEYGRWLILASVGFGMQKPAIPLPIIVVISLLLLLQVLGLAWLAILGSGRSTGTGSLDGFALLRMGAALHMELPPISAMRAGELETLDERPGWIGGAGQEGKTQKLVMGGSEEVEQDTKYRMVENEHDWVMEEKELGGWKRLLCGRYTEMNFDHERSYRSFRALASEDDNDHY